MDWKAKIIINFLDLSVFSIFLIFIFKVDVNFPSLCPKSAIFFSIFFWFYSSKKYIIFSRKSEIWRIKSKKIRKFHRKLRKLSIQIKDDYYINWKNVQIGKIFKLQCVVTVTSSQHFSDFVIQLTNFWETFNRNSSFGFLFIVHFCHRIQTYFSTFSLTN